MKKLLMIIFLGFILSGNVKAGCDDALGDSVDYSNCQFSEGQDPGPLKTDNLNNQRYRLKRRRNQLLHFLKV